MADHHRGAGGYSENYTATLDSVEVYDPNTQTWTAAPSMPTPRGDTMCTTLNSALVVIGGYYDPTGKVHPVISTRMSSRVQTPTSPNVASITQHPHVGKAVLNLCISVCADGLLSQLQSIPRLAQYRTVARRCLQLRLDLAVSDYARNLGGGWLDVSMVVMRLTGCTASAEFPTPNRF